MGNVVARVVGEWAWNVLGEQRQRTWDRLRRIDGGGGWWWWQLPPIRHATTMMMIVTSEHEAPLARILRRCDVASSRLGGATDPNLDEDEVVSCDALASITEDEAERLLAVIGTAWYRRGNYSGWIVWLWDRGGDRASYLCRAFLHLPGEADPVRLYCEFRCANKRETVLICVAGEDPVAGGDALLRILGKARQVRQYEFTAMSSNGQFPFSVEALRGFLRDIQDGRRPMHADRDGLSHGCYSYTKVSFMWGWLSEAQKRVLAFECQRDIHLEVYESCWCGGSGIGPLVEAIERDMCPAHLTIFGRFEYQMGEMGTLRNAFASNTCVESVTCMGGSFHDLSQLLLLNTGLRCFHLIEGLPQLGDGFGPAEWNMFWDAVASHPTLQLLDLGNVELSGYPAAQLEQMAQSLQSSSTSLQYICTGTDFLPILRDQVGAQPMQPPPHGDRSEQIPIFRDRVLPLLLLNRFRPKVEAILSEADPGTRSALFRRLLIGDDTVRNSTDRTFYLLQEATGLFIECLPRRNGVGPEAVPAGRS